MNCNDCNKNGAFEHEAALTFAERTIKRLWVLIIILVLLLVATNAAWLWYESQWEDISVEQEVDTGNGDAKVIGMGDINYGESAAESDNAAAQNGR